jgi:hypothetical protein
MQSAYQFARNVALVLMALVLPAAAGSIKAYKYSEAVTGVKNTTVQVSLAFNPTTDKITGSLNFKGGVFGGITDNFSGTATCNGTICVFVLNTRVGGDNLSYTVTVSDPPGTLNLITANGNIWNKRADGTFAYGTAVPESGSKLSYLVPSSIALFAGILLSGKQHRNFSVFRA